MYLELNLSTYKIEYLHYDNKHKQYQYVEDNLTILLNWDPVISLASFMHVRTTIDDHAKAFKAIPAFKELKQLATSNY